MEVKERICLRCNKKFKSDGPQNRICACCARHTPKTHQKATKAFPQRKGGHNTAI